MSALPPDNGHSGASWRGRIGPEPDNRQLSRNYHSRVQLPPKPGGAGAASPGIGPLPKSH
jgi:hypothetical protein